MTKKNARPLLAAAAMLLLVGAACSSDSNSSSSSSSSATSAAIFSFTPLDVGGPNTKAALSKGDIDIALLFSSDGAIVKNNWVALDDDKKLQPVDNFVPAITKAKATPDVTAVLDAVSAKLTRDEVQKLVASVSIDGQNPKDVAKQWLSENSLPGSLKATGSFQVGSATFAESEIASELYGQALDQAGAEVTYKQDFASREVYLPALENGSIDIVPEFVGTLAAFLGGNATSDLTKTFADAKRLAEAKGFTLGAAASADSVNTFVVTKATADKYSLKTMSDLAKVKDKLRLGGPPECPTRPFCIQGLKSTYGLQFNV